MITGSKILKWQLWLVSFLATGGVWTYFGNSASAQSTGTITLDSFEDLIIIDNLNVIPVQPSNTVFNSEDGGSISINIPSIPITNGNTVAGNIVLNVPSIPITSGGNIVITADLNIVPVPEPASILGVLATGAVGIASVLKCKWKNKQR